MQSTVMGTSRKRYRRVEKGGYEVEPFATIVGSRIECKY